MGDRGEMIDDPEPGPQSEQGWEAGRANSPLTLDAEAILQKLDRKSPGLSHSPDPGALPASFPAFRPGGGSTMVGMLPEGLGEGGGESGDLNSPAVSDPLGDGASPTTGSDGVAGHSQFRPGDISLVVEPEMIVSNPAAGDGPSRWDRAITPDAARVGSGDGPEPFVLGRAGIGKLSPGAGAPAPARTISIRDAFPPGLREDASAPRASGDGGANLGPEGWVDSNRVGESMAEGVGSRHGVSAEDLLKTNELLRQLVEETKMQRVASLPAAGPRVYPGR